MGKNLLVSYGISREAIDAAEFIAHEFRSSRLVLDDVFWLQREEDGNTNVALGIPGVTFFGIRPALEDLEPVIRKLEERDIAPDWDQILILDTNSYYVTALRRALHPYQRSDYQLSDVWVDGVYFGGFYTIRIEPVISVACELVLDDATRGFLNNAVINAGHVYVWARGLSEYPKPVIIGHGRSTPSPNPEGITVNIEIPEKYGIDSSDTLLCHPYLLQTKAQLGSNATGRIGHVIIDFNQVTKR